MNHAHKFRYPQPDGKEKLRGVCRCGKARWAKVSMDRTFNLVWFRRKKK